jgi:AraC-like DNA-binding protein
MKDTRKVSQVFWSGERTCVRRQCRLRRCEPRDLYWTRSALRFAPASGFRRWIWVAGGIRTSCVPACGLRFATASTADHVGRAMDRRIEAAIEIIHNELHRNIPVLELARRVRLSTSHFIRLFKTETSLSPKQYVRCLRMEQAEALLNGSFLSVKEIAASLGAGDRSHFSRDFKKLHGDTPTTFRGRERVSSK